MIVSDCCSCLQPRWRSNSDRNCCLDHREQLCFEALPGLLRSAATHRCASCCSLYTVMVMHDLSGAVAPSRSSSMKSCYAVLDYYPHLYFYDSTFCYCCFRSHSQWFASRWSLNYLIDLQSGVVQSYSLWTHCYPGRGPVQCPAYHGCR